MTALALALAALAITINQTTGFWFVLAASVIGLLLEPWPAKPWKIVAAIILLVLAVLIVFG